MVKIPLEVIQAARKEYQVVLKSGQNLAPILYKRRIIGFYYPHQCKIGMRVGPIFVLPEFRRLGLALGVYNRIKVPLVACVRNDNPASIALHERAGFIRWRPYSAGWWYRRQ